MPSGSLTAGSYHENDWVASTDQNLRYRSNGLTRGTAMTATGLTHARLVVNLGGTAALEASHWNIANVIVYNRTLTAPEVATVEAWLRSMYATYTIATLPSRLSTRDVATWSPTTDGLHTATVSYAAQTMAFQNGRVSVYRHMDYDRNKATTVKGRDSLVIKATVTITSTGAFDLYGITQYTEASQHTNKIDPVMGWVPAPGTYNCTWTLARTTVFEATNAAGDVVFHTRTSLTAMSPIHGLILDTVASGTMTNVSVSFANDEDVQYVGGATGIQAGVTVTNSAATPNAIYAFLSSAETLANTAYPNPVSVGYPYESTTGVANGGNVYVDYDSAKTLKRIDLWGGAVPTYQNITGLEVYGRVGGAMQLLQTFGLEARPPTVAYASNSAFLTSWTQDVAKASLAIAAPRACDRYELRFKSSTHISIGRMRLVNSI